MGAAGTEDRAGWQLWAQAVLLLRDLVLRAQQELQPAAARAWLTEAATVPGTLAEDPDRASDTSTGPSTGSYAPAPATAFQKHFESVVLGRIMPTAKAAEGLAATANTTEAAAASSKVAATVTTVAAGSSPEYAAQHLRDCREGFPSSMYSPARLGHHKDLLDVIWKVPRIKSSILWPELVPSTTASASLLKTYLSRTAAARNAEGNSENPAVCA